MFKIGQKVKVRTNTVIVNGVVDIKTNEYKSDRAAYIKYFYYGTYYIDYMMFDHLNTKQDWTFSIVKCKLCNL